MEPKDVRVQIILTPTDILGLLEKKEESWWFKEGGCLLSPL
jgi:hypothetical protein